MGVTQLKASLQALNKKIDCYNQYVSTMKTSLQTLSFIPEDLRRLMREEEISRARVLAEDRYYEFAVKEKSVNEALQMTLSQRYSQQARNAKSTRDNFDANGYWPWRANYDRQQTPQMTTNPKFTVPSPDQIKGNELGVVGGWRFAAWEHGWEHEDIDRVADAALRAGGHRRVAPEGEISTLGWRLHLARAHEIVYLAPTGGTAHSEVHERYQRVLTDPDAFEIVGGQLDLRPATRELVLLDAPSTPLCRPDCAGLCPYCGGNRNEVACDCTPPPVSHWADLGRAEHSEGG